MNKKNQWEDPIVAEVRRVRDALAKQFNYDVEAICANLMKRQGKTVTIEELRARPYPTPSAKPAMVRETPPKKSRAK